MRLAVLASHPIQYQAPLFRVLSARPGVDLTVFFLSRHGLEPTLDRHFGRTFRYDVPLIEGYRHAFLTNYAPSPGLAGVGAIHPAVLRVVAWDRFDAVVVHGYASVSTLMAIVGPRLRAKVLLRGDSNSVQPPPRSWRKRLVKRLALGALFRRVDHFLTAGTRNREYYSSYGVPDEAMTLAPFSVDNDYFATRSAEARADPRRVRESLGISDDGPLFLFAGKLVAIKRPFDLLDAFEAAMRDAGPAHLAYVGDGVLAGALDEAIRSRGLVRKVHKLGFRNQSELPAIYGASDVFVLPSAIEPWGLAVNEAMACGAACVVSDRVGAQPDLVPDPGCVFEAGNVDGLASILARFIRDPLELTQKKVEAARRIAHWGLEQTADGVLAGARAALDVNARSRRSNLRK
jgi:glycosyltransferase involved in cell wall biosynthesis